MTRENSTSQSTIHSLLEDSAQFLRKHSRVRPKLGVVLGSGLSAVATQVQSDLNIGYAEVPNFAASTVEGHPGRLVMGRLEGVDVAIMQGRLHPYEGLTMQQAVFPVRTLAVLGVKSLLVTNAAGGLNAKMKPGDFVVIRDHINLTGDNPLRGPNLELGPRFTDMTEAYCKSLRALLKSALREARARHSEGVYVGVLGPSYETAAEIKFFAKLGGAVVGMSTVAEVIAARHAGLRVAGLSCVTNLGTGLSKKPLSHEDVKKVAQMSEEKFTATLMSFLRKFRNQS